MSIRVLLADDHTVLRQALRDTLARQEDIEVVAEAGDGVEVLRLAKECDPQVVIMDIGMPLVDGIDATRQIVAASPEVAVLAVSAHLQRHYVMRMLNAGARGYITKCAPLAEVLRAIRALAARSTYLSPDVAALVAGAVRPQARNRAMDGELLGRREQQVLAQVAEGKSSQEIADKLHIAKGTVGVHRQNIMRKLGLRTVAELTKYAIERGLISA